MEVPSVVEEAKESRETFEVIESVNEFDPQSPSMDSYLEPSKVSYKE